MSAPSLAGITVGVVLLSAPLLTVGTALSTQGSLRAATDNAALAAADTLWGYAEGDPCERAAEVAATVGANLATCERQETSTLITLERTILGVSIRATARAGPRAGYSDG